MIETEFWKVNQISNVIARLESKSGLISDKKWNKFYLHCYIQLWSQLSLQESVLCRAVKSTVVEEKSLVVVLSSLRQQFLKISHDQAGHQGTEHTLSQLSRLAYWVDMSKDVSKYCSVCPKCLYTKSSPGHLAPFQPVIASKPWELVAVDILKIPISSSRNQYIHVAQGYFLSGHSQEPCLIQKLIESSKFWFLL